MSTLSLLKVTELLIIRTYGDTLIMLTSSQGPTFRITVILGGKRPITGEFPTQADT